MKDISRRVRPILIACAAAASATNAALAQGPTGEWDCQATVQPLLQGATAHIIADSNYRPRRLFADNSYSVHLRATELASPYTFGLDFLRHPQTLETLNISMRYAADAQGANTTPEAVRRSAASLNVRVPGFMRDAASISQVRVSIRGTAANFVFSYPGQANTLSIYRGSPPPGAANVAMTPAQFDAIAELFHSNTPLTIEYEDAARRAVMASVTVPAAGRSQEPRISLATRALDQARERLQAHTCSPFIPDLYPNR